MQFELSFISVLLWCFEVGVEEGRKEWRSNYLLPQFRRLVKCNCDVNIKLSHFPQNVFGKILLQVVFD